MREALWQGELITGTGEVIRSAIRAAEDSLVRSIAKSGAHGVCPTNIAIEVQATASGYELIARYTVGASDPTERRSLWLDCRQSPLSVRHISSGVVASYKSQGDHAAKERLIELVLKDGAFWHDAQFEVTFEWDPNGNPQCLVLPPMLPSIVHSYEFASKAEILSRPSIIVHRRSRGLVLAGIAQADGAVRDGQRMIEAALIPESAVDPDMSTEVVILTAALGRGLSIGEKARINRLCERILQFVGSDLGQQAEVRLIARAESERQTMSTADTGSCLTFAPNQFGLHDSAGAPRDVYVAGQLSRAYWGGGCKVAGRSARELEGAINLALGLRWLAHIADTTKRRDAFERVQEISSEARLTDWLAGLRGHIRRRTVSRLGWAFYQHMSKTAEAANSLKQITASGWGSFVSESHVRKCLFARM